MARYFIGIDLGTTNTALAYVDTQAKGKNLRPTTFPIPQLIAAGQVGTANLLPSFYYLPGQHDLPAGATNLPWNQSASEVVGRFARDQGAKVPGRLVSSAKSWLCHAGVDRTAPLLPWGGPPEVPRLSPLEVSTRYLKHLADGWNHAHKATGADRLEQLPVVLTVPASFDDVARSLTAEAAKQAGFLSVSLIEEPQAAFYAWLATHSATEAGQLQAGMRCLVVDVGGGTTDLSLIRAIEEGGEIGFARDAVGDHLLLGGDNMDLALAKSIETRARGGKLDANQFGSLIQACRQAKEALLGPNPPEKVPITLVGRGRSVIAGSVTTEVTLADVQAAIMDGFFPFVPYDAEPQRAGKTGLQEMGLPYVADAGISRHLAAFLRRHLPSDDQGKPAPIDAILFNGGVFNPAPLRDRVIEVMRPWFDRADKPWQPLVLTTPSLDLAVAWGAAHFNWIKQTGGKRISGGVPRSYYVGVEAKDDAGQAVLCVVPRRMQEGDQVEIPEPELELQLGQPVLLPLYTSTIRGNDQPGDLLQVEPGQLRALPPLHTLLRGGKRSGAKRVPVTLEARCTEIGTLELHCVSKEGNRWRMEFNVRDLTADGDNEPAQNLLVDVFPEERIVAAGNAIRNTFEANTTPTPQELPKVLEAELELSRNDWPAGLCRRLWQHLEEVAASRTRSPSHLARWYNLAGFCLRPGFGDPLDRYRVDSLWKLVTSSTASGPAKNKGPGIGEGGENYWILWRRVAGGLPAPLQQSLFQRLRQHLLPGKSKPSYRAGASELTEMWRTAASFERLDARTRTILGDDLVRQLRASPKAVPPYLFWSLTRLGARRPLYGPLNSLVHPETVSSWLEQLLDLQPTTENDRLGWSFCLAQLARRLDLRGADVPEQLRLQVLDRLATANAPSGWRALVEEVIDDQGDDRSRLFGESLPIGLRVTKG